jgi:hypothetical protein
LGSDRKAALACTDWLNIIEGYGLLRLMASTQGCLRLTKQEI